MNIYFSNRSITNLRGIKEYIQADSVYYANSFVKKLIASTKILNEFPNIGRIVPEYNINSVREIIYQNYRIIYKIENDNIYILSVIHGSRKLTKHLKKKDIDNI